jgi:hypothetical protein
MDRRWDGFQKVRYRKVTSCVNEGGVHVQTQRSRGEATETRKSGFRIIIAETRGACVIAIIWLDLKVGREQDGLKR